jgi:hypothetical protein
MGSDSKALRPGGDRSLDGLRPLDHGRLRPSPVHDRAGPVHGGAVGRGTGSGLRNA